MVADANTQQGLHNIGLEMFLQPYAVPGHFAQSICELAPRMCIAQRLGAPQNLLSAQEPHQDLTHLTLGRDKSHLNK